MSSFDFTALIIFLQGLFEAFVKLIEKLGFKFGGDDAADTTNTDAATGTDAAEG